MRALLLIVVLFAVQVACAPARVERHEFHELETQGRAAHPHAALLARDLHPLTPILLAELDHSIPAAIVAREVAVAEPETDDEPDVAAEPEEDEHAQMVEDDDTALIESEFDISAPYGFGGFGGGYGYGKKGGFYGGYGSKKIPYKKVPYKKIPYKKVPFKKGPPKKKLPPKKPFPPKKGFGGKKGGFGFGGGKKGGFGFGGYGGFGGGHVH